MTGKLRKIGIAAVAAATFGGAIAMTSTEAMAFKGGFGGGGFGGHGFGGGGFGGHGFGGGGFAARGFGGGGFAASGFGGAGPMVAGRSVAAHPGFATRGFAGAGFAGVRPGFAGRNFVFHRGFRHRGFGFGLGAGWLPRLSSARPLTRTITGAILMTTGTATAPMRAGIRIPTTGRTA